jgi:hypothetical protein
MYLSTYYLNILPKECFTLLPREIWLMILEDLIHQKEAIYLTSRNRFFEMAITMERLYSICLNKVYRNSRTDFKTRMITYKICLWPEKNFRQFSTYRYYMPKPSLLVCHHDYYFPIVKKVVPIRSLDRR